MRRLFTVVSLLLATLAFVPRTTQAQAFAGLLAVTQDTVVVDTAGSPPVVIDTVAATDAATQAAQGLLDILGNVATWLLAIIGGGILALLKKVFLKAQYADYAITKVTKKFQPVLLGVLTLLLPLLGGVLPWLHVPSADMLATAPTSTVLGVVLAELSEFIWEKLKPLVGFATPQAPTG